jgi:hypothetical protein
MLGAAMCTSIFAASLIAAGAMIVGRKSYLRALRAQDERHAASRPVLAVGPLSEAVKPT